MQDGQTRKLAHSRLKQSLFLARHRACLVVLAGPAAGTEHELQSESVVLGRGPGVDIAFADDSMSRRHAALELGDEGYRVRDMGSTNGVLVNGHPAPAADLKHGDRLQLGEQRLQYVVEHRSRPPTHEL